MSSKEQETRSKKPYELKKQTQHETNTNIVSNWNAHNFGELYILIRLGLIFQRMGGPCKLVREDGKKCTAPACTDNFQVRPFVYDGVRYHSCEQAFQAHKFLPGPDRERISKLRPNIGESDHDFGMRCWSAGQHGSAEYFRSDWEAVKVGIMFAVNEAKYLQHDDLRNDLLATGSLPIIGGPSTSWTFRGNSYGWSNWNGLIQMRLREQFRAPEERAPGVLEGLLAQFDAYFADT